MTDQKHSPLIYEGSGEIWGKDLHKIYDPEDNFFCAADTKEKAEFIVKVVNSHYKLVEACHDSLPILKALRDTIQDYDDYAPHNQAIKLITEILEEVGDTVFLTKEEKTLAEVK